MEIGPDIVKDSLQQYFDFGNVKSYPGIDTTIYDLGLQEENSVSFTNTTSDQHNSSMPGFFTFNGTDQQIRIPDVKSNDATIEVWFQRIGNGGVAGDGGHWRLYTSSGNLTFWAREDNSGTTATVGGGSISTGIWYLASAVMESGVGIKLYVNGELQNTTAHNVTYYDGSDNTVLAGNYNNSNYGNHSISILRIYNRVLTADEIAQNYNAQHKRFGL